MSGIIPKPPAPVLPALPATVLPAIDALTAALGIPRNVLASADDIEHAWHDLPRELREIPPQLRGELVARMCVAVSSGLFDGAMNYIWNAAILQLRAKTRNFGLPIVAQILQTDFEERNLLELQDSRLLELCLKLNLVDEEGYFFLDQCREVRNNFSAAHPTMGAVNDREFTTFLNRCVRYALADASSPKGVDIGAFITAVKGARFNANQNGIWVQRLSETHDVGLFVCTGGFTKDAETEARTQEKRRVTLIGLEKLFDLWVEHYGKLTDLARRRLPLRPIQFLSPGG